MIVGKEKGNGNCAWHSTAPGSTLLGFARKRTAVLGLIASKGHFHPQCSTCNLSQSHTPPSQRKQAAASWVTERGDGSGGKALSLLTNPETDGKARSWNWHSCANPGLQIWVLKTVSYSLVLSVLRQYSPFSSEGKKQLAETQTVFICTRATTDCSNAGRVKIIPGFLWKCTPSWVLNHLQGIHLSTHYWDFHPFKSWSKLVF